MTVKIEISDDLAGYSFQDENGNTIQFEELTRLQQIHILNSFFNGYDLFRKCLKEE